MALFFKTGPSKQVKDVIAEALAIPPASITDPRQLTAELLGKAQPELKDSIEVALTRTPLDPEQTQKLAAEIVANVPSGNQEIAWGRVLAALAFLVLLFLAGVYTAHDDALKDWSKALLNTFTVVLGAVGAIITGEAAGKR